MAIEYIYTPKVDINYREYDYDLQDKMHAPFELGISYDPHGNHNNDNSVPAVFADPDDPEKFGSIAVCSDAWLAESIDPGYSPNYDPENGSFNFDMRAWWTTIPGDADATTQNFGKFQTLLDSSTTDNGVTTNYIRVVELDSEGNWVYDSTGKPNYLSSVSGDEDTSFTAGLRIKSDPAYDYDLKRWTVTCTIVGIRHKAGAEGSTFTLYDNVRLVCVGTYYPIADNPPPSSSAPQAVPKYEITTYKHKTYETDAGAKAYMIMDGVETEVELEIYFSDTAYFTWRRTMIAPNIFYDIESGRKIKLVQNSVSFEEGVYPFFGTELVPSITYFNQLVSDYYEILVLEPDESVMVEVTYDEMIMGQRPDKTIFKCTEEFTITGSPFVESNGKIEHYGETFPAGTFVAVVDENNRYSNNGNPVLHKLSVDPYDVFRAYPDIGGYPARPLTYDEFKVCIASGDITGDLEGYLTKIVDGDGKELYRTYGARNANGEVRPALAVRTGYYQGNEIFTYDEEKYFPDIWQYKEMPKAYKDDPEADKNSSFFPCDLIGGHWQKYGVEVLDERFFNVGYSISMRIGEPCVLGRHSWLQFHRRYIWKNGGSDGQWSPMMGPLGDMWFNFWLPMPYEPFPEDVRPLLKVVPKENTVEVQTLVGYTYE